MFPVDQNKVSLSIVCLKPVSEVQVYTEGYKNSQNMNTMGGLNYYF